MPVTPVFSTTNTMRIHSFLASSSYLSCPHWASSFALLPDSHRTEETDSGCHQVIRKGGVGGLWGFYKVRTGQNCIEMQRTGLGAIKRSCVQSLANLRQTGMPGCLQEALRQLGSKWQFTGVAQGVLERRGLTGARGESLTLLPPHLARALRSLNDIMPLSVCLHPPVP